MTALRLSEPVRLALAGAFALAASVGIGRFVYTPILPHMMAELGLDPGEAGLLASANLLGYLLGAMVATLPGLPGARRRWWLGGLVASVATTALSGASAALPILIVVRLAGGIASAFVFVFGAAIVLDRLAELGRSSLVATLFTGPGIGILSSSLLVSALATAGFGWRSLWFVSAAVGLASIALVIALTPAATPGSPRAAPKTLRLRPSRPGSLPRIAASYGLFGFGYIISATFIVALARSAPELARTEPLIWPVVGVTAIPSVAIWNRLARRIGESRVYVLCCCLAAAGVALSILWRSPAGILLGAAALGATFVAGTTLGLVIANHLSDRDSRRVIGVMTSCFGLGQILGPIFAGYLFRLSGSFLLPMLTSAAILLIAAALAPSTRQA